MRGNVLTKKERFELFWDHYHKCTGQPKTTKRPAERYWNKLKITEEREAYIQVPFYVKFMRKQYGEKTTLHKARTYLGDYLFEDDYRSLLENQNNQKKVFKGW